MHNQIYSHCLALLNEIDALLEWSKCKVLHIGKIPYVGKYRLDGTQSGFFF